MLKAAAEAKAEKEKLTAEANEEKKKHSSGLVPYSYYKCLIPDYFAGVPLHWHSEFEINLIISGSSDFICGDTRFTAREGDIIMIPPNMLHAIHTVGGKKQRYDTIVFSPEMLGLSGDRCTFECITPLITGKAVITPRITKEHIYYSELEISVRNIFSCAIGNTPGLDMLIKSELLRLIWLLHESGDISVSYEKSKSRSEIIRPAIEYMNENLCENITVETLAEAVHMSKSYFMKRFHEAAGASAIEYLTRLRIKKACSILSETDMTCARTAYECGFRNLSNFNRQFKKSVGVTPVEYRKHTADPERKSVL